jgi:putative transcriptional regulator
MGAVESLRGQLLLAAPALTDPNFQRTVVLIGEHNADGALGVVLNRPSPLTVAQAVPALGDAVDGDGAVYVGGPVAPNSIMFLAEFLEPSYAALLVFGRIGLLSSQAEIDELPSATERGRVFAGHAGWGPGQLDAEFDNGDWIAEPARPQDVFTDDPDGLWGAVLTRKGGRFSLLARMPPDPSVN